MTLAVLQVTTVRNTVTAAPPWISIVSPALAPIQPNVIPVTAGTSRNKTSFGPIVRGERNWLGGVATSTPPGVPSVLRPDMHEEIVGALYVHDGLAFPQIEVTADDLITPWRLACDSPFRAGSCHRFVGRNWVI